MIRGCEQLFVVNPVIQKYEKRYILGIDHKAKAIFEELCTRRVRIDGFIDDQNAGMLLYHKPVCSIHKLEMNPSHTILLSDSADKQFTEYQICSEICILNPKLYQKKIMIYGTGNIGKKVYSILKDKGVEIVGFLDSDEEKNGTLFCGENVYSKNKLKTASEDIAIIEAANRYKEIENIINSMNEDLLRFYICDFPFESKGIWVDREKYCMIAEYPVVQLGEYCRHEQIKELILYGNDLLLAKKYAEVLKCLDFQLVTFMVDGKNIDEPNIFSIEEIISRDNYLVLLYGNVEYSLLDKLSALGVKRRYYGDIISTYQWRTPSAYYRKVLLDVNMGYTYESKDCIYPGICMYGKNHPEDYKIAVLGESTTDSGFDPRIPSWVEIMYNQYCRTDITIFNGGTGGYSATQKILKLIRDIIKLNPNMIIIYDGYNALIQDNEFPFLEKLVNYAGSSIQTRWDAKIEKREAWRGIPSEKDKVSDWLESIEYMYALARSKNIEFYAFMQPLLFTKKSLDPHSKTLLQLPLADNQIFMDTARQFRDRAEEFEHTHNYIHNLTDIFDDVDVYMDIVHVYENGNRILAEHIWNAIKNIIK